MSWSHSSPDFKTKTSPCSVGFMVPASTFRYGSTLIALTAKPRAWRIFAIEEVATPLPTPDMTPPITNIYLWSFFAMLRFRYECMNYEILHPVKYDLRRFRRNILPWYVFKYCSR